MSLAVYSLLLAVGSIALKVVLLYFKIYVRITIAIYIITDLIILLFTFVFAFVDMSVLGQTLFTLLYQLALNGPTLILMIPLWLYLTEIEKYMKTYYPTLIAKGLAANLGFQTKSIKTNHTLL